MKPASVTTADPRAHPRSRGEHVVIGLFVLALVGSSPLARGTSAREVVAHRCTGLIPARAGNIPVADFQIFKARAHPRSRGEHATKCEPPEPPQGSSPLARGTSYGSSLTPGLSGLIPARAGNIYPFSSDNWLMRAHPRSRGEHRESRLLLMACLGSSPLARGTWWFGAHQAARRGLIPARAGNIVWKLANAWSGWAHPRSRGEHVQCGFIPTAPQGSSPLARGT